MAYNSARDYIFFKGVRNQTAVCTQISQLGYPGAKIE